MVDHGLTAEDADMEYSSPDSHSPGGKTEHPSSSGVFSRRVSLIFRNPWRPECFSICPAQLPRLKAAETMLAANSVSRGHS